MVIGAFFCPNEAPGLHGVEFETLYEKYEKDGKQRKRILAQDLVVRHFRGTDGNWGPIYVGCE